jgi:hypothetical protein
MTDTTSVVAFIAKGKGKVVLVLLFLTEHHAMGNRWK